MVLCQGAAAAGYLQHGPEACVCVLSRLQKQRKCCGKQGEIRLPRELVGFDRSRAQRAGHIKAQAGHYLAGTISVTKPPIDTF